MIATLRSLVIQALIFFAIFIGLSAFQQSDMLSTDTKLNETRDLVFTQVPTLNQDTVSLTSQGRTTVIYFFAPWCQVCHFSIGNLQSLYEKNNELNVIGVVMDYSSIAAVENFTQQHQLTFPIALGNEEIKQAFAISAYPSYYVINEDNYIIGKSMGYSSELGLYLRSL